MAFVSSGSGGGYGTTGWTMAGDQLTMTIWLRTTQTTLNAIPFGKCNGATQGGPSIVMNNPSAGKYLLYAKEGGSEPVKGTSTSTNLFNDGEWHNFIIRYDRRSGMPNEVWLDGVLDIQVNATGNITKSGDGITAGRSNDGFWNGFNGDHAYMAAWDKWLDDDEVQMIGTHRVNPGLVARSKLMFYVPSHQALRQAWTPGGFGGTIGSPGNSPQPNVRGVCCQH
ncbi:LamG-like jellyroll fold domain-containing protein [Sphingobium sp.]|uniref:LamG-like jellyroll fold domain-containing protein n=1 Tax=Sphingobium sp. TaxID=1912891 RepID=UPI00257C0C9F|nr:LamG-like jellyroll fold domain-containing protein [Sphingobium sp.]